MTAYLIYFNQQWVGDHPEEWYQTRVAPSTAVVEEMRQAGVLLFAGGLVEELEEAFSADATSGEITITDGPYAERDPFDRLGAMLGPRLDELRSLLDDLSGRWRGDAVRVGEGTRQRLRDLFREGTRPTTEEVAGRIGFDPLDTAPLVADLSAT